MHDELKPAKTFADLKHLAGRSDTNVTVEFNLDRGDVENAFGAPIMCSSTHFKSPTVAHTPLEPLVSLAEMNGSTLTIHTASQMPSFVRIEIARLLGWPESRVRVKVLHLGGGFAAKTLHQARSDRRSARHCLSNRPVKIAATMDEQFYIATSHAATLRIKSGVTKEGRIIARQCEVWWNCGAYADVGPRMAQKSGFTAAGPYDIENVQINSQRSLHQFAAVHWRVAALASRICRGLMKATPTLSRANSASIRWNSAAVISCAKESSRRPARSMPDDSIALVLERWPSG